MALAVARSQALSVCLPAATHLSRVVLHALKRYAAGPAAPTSAMSQIRHSHSLGATPLPAALNIPSDVTAADPAGCSGAVLQVDVYSVIQQQLEVERIGGSSPFARHQQDSQCPISSASIDPVLGLFDASPVYRATAVASTLSSSSSPSSASADGLMVAIPENGWCNTWRDDNAVCWDDVWSPKQQPSFLPRAAGAVRPSEAVMMERAAEEQEQRRLVMSSNSFVSITPGVMWRLDDTCEAARKSK